MLKVTEPRGGMMAPPPPEADTLLKTSRMTDHFKRLLDPAKNTPDQFFAVIGAEYERLTPEGEREVMSMRRAVLDAMAGTQCVESRRRHCCGLAEVVDSARRRLNG